MKDIAGQEIHIGDEVIYFQGGRYDSINFGTVVDMKKTVKVDIVESTRGHKGTTWASSSRVYVR